MIQRNRDLEYALMVSAGVVSVALITKFFNSIFPASNVLVNIAYSASAIFIFAYYEEEFYRTNMVDKEKAICHGVAAGLSVLLSFLTSYIIKGDLGRCVMLAYAFGAHQFITEVLQEGVECIVETAKGIIEDIAMENERQKYQYCVHFYC